MSWKPVMIISASERTLNSLRFDTETEARGSARALFHRWIVPMGYEAEECTDPVNYRRVGGYDIPIERFVFSTTIGD
jgi:hypothetical protein